MTKAGDGSSEDKAAIQAVLDRQGAAWKAGDAQAFAADVQAGIVFTNVVGRFSVGRAPFVAQHAHIFATFYKDSVLTQALEALTFVHPDVAVVNTLAELEGAHDLPPDFPHTGDAIRSRLEQVMVRDGARWTVAAFHNVLVVASAAGPPPGS